MKPASLLALIIHISCLFTTWDARTTVYASWSRSSSRGAILPRRSRKAALVFTNRRDWWQRSPKPCTLLIQGGWFTETSSLPTS